MPKKQTEWSRAYNERSYDRLAITIPKGRKADVAAKASADGKSINALVNELLRDYLAYTPTEWNEKSDALDE